ncbi:hypothetical protein BurJ1DRAFT_0739 [Burkholderiales bacterium JOSHI_001]|nr:hypothetical protein BurJ1DRAFT_0739 [Burkholderiales bacterium JOSHI_001]
MPGLWGDARRAPSATAAANEAQSSVISARRTDGRGECLSAPKDRGKAGNWAGKAALFPPSWARTAHHTDGPARHCQRRATVPALPDTLRPALPTAASRGARALPWPLPALLAWGLAWGVHAALLQAQFSVGAALVLASGVPLMAAGLLPAGTHDWRRAIVAGGFPLSALASGGLGPLPAWWWLLPLALLWLAYPRRAWRDAPMFPTPAMALDGLGEAVNLPPGARVLDAGCGMGHGLDALQAALPLAQVHGIEWSWPLRAVAAWRCPQATVKRGDMWAEDWGRYDLVYLFQRPESMARAWAQAQQQMRPGAWLVSLEFAVPGVDATAELHNPGGKPAWLYRVGDPGAQFGRRRADKNRRAPATPGAADAPPVRPQEQSLSGS